MGVWVGPTKFSHLSKAQKNFTSFVVVFCQCRYRTWSCKYGFEGKIDQKLKITGVEIAWVKALSHELRIKHLLVPPTQILKFKIEFQENWTKTLIFSDSAWFTELVPFFEVKKLLTEKSYIPIPEFNLNILICIPCCVPIECYSHINCLILGLLSKTGFGLLATSKNMNISSWSEIVSSHCNTVISLFTSFWIGQTVLIQIPSFIIRSDEEKIDICGFVMVNVLL